MASAALRPSATASMAVAGPRRRSPMANRLPWPLCMVSGWDSSVLPAGEGEGEGLPFHKAEIRLLRHGRNHGIKLFKEELTSGLRASATGGIRLAEGHLLEAHLTDATSLIGQILYRIGEHQKAHTFLLRLVDFVGFGGHLGAGAAIDKGGFSAQPDRRAGAVDRGITTPDHRNLLAGGEPLGQHLILEVIDPEITTGQGAARVIHRHRLGSANRQTDRIIVAAQRREGDLVAQSLAGVDPHATLAHQGDLLIEGRPWAAGIQGCRSAASHPLRASPRTDRPRTPRNPDSNRR